MKTTKKILAAVIVVMMVALMIPFSASAAESTASTAFTLECTKPGFTFDVFKIASVNTETGAITPAANLSAAIKAELDKVDATTAKAQAIIAACDSAAAGTYGTKTGSFTSTDTTTVSNNMSNGAGIYYVKVVNYSHGTDVAKKTESSLVCAPTYDSTIAGEDKWKAAGQIDLTNLKVDDGTTSVSKTIESVDGVTTTVYNNGKAAITDETKDVVMNLTGSVVGTGDKTQNMISKYELNDTMDKELNFKAIQSVSLVAADGSKVALSTADYSVTPSVDAINAQTANHNFTVALSAGVLNTTTKFSGKTFYDFASVEVKYTVDIDASFTAGQVKNNRVDLVFKSNSSEDDTPVPGNDVKVATLGIDLTKVDINNETKVLAGATFGLYTDSACTQQVASVVTTGTGKDIFMDVAAGQTDEYNVLPGTYYIKEIAAPAGYSLNNAVVTVTVTGSFATDGTLNITAENYSNGYFEYTVKETPINTPLTGGAGTMMFTIGGAVLVAGAGVLLFVLLKKKKTTAE